MLELNKTFTLIGEIGVHPYFALDKYLAKKYYPADKLTKSEIQKRQDMWDFKNGRNSVEVARLISYALIHQFSKPILADSTLCIIPASNDLESQRRFENFCNLVSDMTRLKNGYTYIVNKCNSISKHNGGNKSITEKVVINEDYFDNGVFLFDDIITSGDSYCPLADKLIASGAKWVVGIFLGKTSNKIDDFDMSTLH